MLIHSLIHLAILTYFLVPSGLGSKIDLHAEKKAEEKIVTENFYRQYINEGSGQYDALAIAEEKGVVPFDRPFREKCAVRSEIACPMPKKVAEYHWDFRKVCGNFALPEGDAECESHRFLSHVEQGLEHICPVSANDPLKQVRDVFRGVGISGDGPIVNLPLLCWRIDVERCNDLFDDSQEAATPNVAITDSLLWADDHP